MTSNHNEPSAQDSLNIPGMPRVGAASVAALLTALMATGASAQVLDTDIGANVGADVSVSVGSSDSNDNLDLGVGIDADTDLTADTDDGMIDTDVMTDTDVMVDTDLIEDTDIGAVASTDFKLTGQSDDGSFDVTGILDLNVDGDLDNQSGDIEIDDTRIAITDIDDELSLDAQADFWAEIEADDSRDELMASIAANAELSAVLDNYGVDQDDVIGVEVAGDGATMVYVADGHSALSCETELMATTQDWAQIDDIAAASNVQVTAVDDCSVDEMWITADLRAAAMANTEISEELSEDNYDASDILGIAVMTEGVVNVFVEDRS